jgi:hypothetical protein
MDGERCAWLVHSLIVPSDVCGRGWCDAKRGIKFKNEKRE